MIYCHYISHTWDTVTYAYGATIDDITGVVVFHFWKEEGIDDHTEARTIRYPLAAHPECVP